MIKKNVTQKDRDEVLDLFTEILIHYIQKILRDSKTLKKKITKKEARILLMNLGLHILKSNRRKDYIIKQLTKDQDES